MNRFILIIFQFLLCFHHLDFQNAPTVFDSTQSFATPSTISGDSKTTSSNSLVSNVISTTSFMAQSQTPNPEITNNSPTTSASQKVEGVSQSEQTSINSIVRNDSFLSTSSKPDIGTSPTSFINNVIQNMSSTASIVTSSTIITDSSMNTSSVPNTLNFSNVSSATNITGRTTTAPITSIISNAEYTKNTKPGAYSIRIRVTCSFPDVFYDEYNNISSPLTNLYFKTIYNKLGIALSQNQLSLDKIIFHSIKPGSVIIYMTIVLFSNEQMDGLKVLSKFKNAVIMAYNGGVKIISILVIIKSDRNSKSAWIAGLVMAIIISIILLVVAIYLFHRYQIHHLCCKPKPPRAETYNTAGIELEYDTRTDDRAGIINERFNQYA